MTVLELFAGAGEKVALQAECGLRLVPVVVKVKWKTVVVEMHLQHIHLVVCQKSKVEDWVNHFKEHYDFKTFDLTKPKQFGDFHGMVMGGRFTVVGIINYDLIFRRPELSVLKPTQKLVKL